MKRILVIVIAVCAMSSGLFAQQEIMISQYMFNGLVLNPAYSGTHPYWSATALHRSQWVGFDKAPVTQTLCIDGPIAKRKLGLGFTLSNDQIGVTRQLELGANLAYKLFLGSGNLSFGLRAGISSYSADLTEVKVWDETDAVYANNIQGEMIPKVGFGAYYYTGKFYAGFSVPVVYAADKSILPENSSMSRYFTNHMYLHTGYVFEPSLTTAIKPSVLVKYESGAPVEVDVNCNVMFFQKYWLGIGYRTGDALVAMAEWNITPQLRLGYAYDYTLTDIADYSNGSHEVMLGFDFGKDVKMKFTSPRYF
ncbi:MAG: hypothetical protein RL220_1872 [Bacteroidota bacterium]